MIEEIMQAVTTRTLMKKTLAEQTGMKQEDLDHFFNIYVERAKYYHIGSCQLTATKTGKPLKWVEVYHAQTLNATGEILRDQQLRHI